jgi:hypothetical protein
MDLAPPISSREDLGAWLATSVLRAEPVECLTVPLLAGAGARMVW